MPEVSLQFDRAVSRLILLLQQARLGTLTPESAAELLDEIVDTGPWDSADDVLFRGLVDAVDALVPAGVDLWHLFDRDPVAMRARASAVESVNPARAARIRERANRVAARR